MTTEVDDIMAELGLSRTAPPPALARQSADVNALLTELGLDATKDTKVPSNKAVKLQKSPTPDEGESEVDSLLAELGIDVVLDEAGDPAAASHKTSEVKEQVHAGVAPPLGKPGVSAGPGAMRAGMASGPGAVRAGMSSGPGAMRAGVSSGPGARGGLSAGVGAPRASAPATAKPKSERTRPRPVKPKLATHTPDGRTLTYDGPPCSHCNDTIIGSLLSALGGQFHPECFVCAECEREFPNGEFIEKEATPYCDLCYNELFSPKCASCGGAIDDKCVSVGDDKWHPQHFTCDGCGCPLAGKSYKADTDDDGRTVVYCSICKEKRKRRLNPTARTCGKCKQPIIGEFITLRGVPMHPKHFRCEECGCSFAGGNCCEYEGRLYCREDYLKMLKDTCSFCMKPIIGRSVTAMGRVFHPHHFVCFHCKEPFHGSNFMEKDGSPYCELHWHQLFGHVCARCNRPVVGKVIRALGKSFHQEHFTCTGCDAPLGGQVFEFETKAMCKKCYSRLPADVRKRIEKKRVEQKKAADARAKAQSAAPEAGAPK